MPTEDRFITFDLDDIYKAISMHMIRNDTTPLPQGKVSMLEMRTPEGEKVPEDEISEDGMVHLEVETSDDSDTFETNLEKPFFGQAMIYFCIESQIPLPASGKKILRILDDRAILKISL